ncbi:MAG: cytochrome b N-terminal domain-containing protein [Pseudomonadota bacterium]|nr:cytochrome b N-terminal domain-containing protein [Pseudomonadota bacterium]
MNDSYEKFRNPVIRWIDARLPVFSLVKKEYGSFASPRNLNYGWSFGAIALFMLFMMIGTGAFLAMQYIGHVDLAFDSVERIMRDVNHGWLIRSLHSTGASMFFFIVYLHMARSLYYGSYKSPREMLWITGVLMFFLMMGTAFMGYVLPWDQVGYWGATVITSMLSAIPIIGDTIVEWALGCFAVGNPTLARFYAIHFILPFIICGVLVLHIWTLHVTGSNNPLGIEPKTTKDTITFHPFYTVKNMFALTVFLIVYLGMVFFASDFFSHPDNYIQADPLVTPEHIAPKWYFLPFYAILRAVPFKLGGVIAMLGSVGVLFLVPWLDTSKVRSARFRPVFRLLTVLLFFDVLLLGLVGSMPAEGVWIVLGRTCAVWYFAHFLVFLPVAGKLERPLPMPGSIAEADGGDTP